MKTKPELSTSEYEERISYLEGKLKTIMEILEKVVESEAKRTSSDSHPLNKDFLILGNLIEKAIGDQTYKLLEVVIENMPFPVFIKNEFGRYLIVNSLEASLFNLSISEIIGKHDSDFLNDEKEIEIVRKTDEQVLSGRKSVKLPEQSFTMLDGRHYVFKTQKIPFENPITGKTNILGFSVDVTDTVNLDKLKKVVLLTKNPVW